MSRFSIVLAIAMVASLGAMADDASASPRTARHTSRHHRHQEPTPAEPVAPPVTPVTPVRPTGDMSARARELADAINRYRVENGLPAIPISPSLTTVATTHVVDLRDATPSPGCNAHSWSSRGAWSSCCYTADHAQAACMWNKPAELTHWSTPGFEIAVGEPGKTGGGFVLTAASAIEIWKKSPPHNDVILNRGTWAKTTWRAMGAGISDSHASAWFAAETDPVAKVSR